MRRVEAEQGRRHFDVLFVIQAVEKSTPLKKCRIWANVVHVLFCL